MASRTIAVKGKIKKQVPPTAVPPPFSWRLSSAFAPVTGAPSISTFATAVAAAAAAAAAPLPTSTHRQFEIGPFDLTDPNQADMHTQVKSALKAYIRSESLGRSLSIALRDEDVAPDVPPITPATVWGISYVEKGRAKMCGFWATKEGAETHISAAFSETARRFARPYEIDVVTNTP